MASSYEPPAMGQMRNGRTPGWLIFPTSWVSHQNLQVTFTTYSEKPWEGGLYDLPEVATDPPRVSAVFCYCAEAGLGKQLHLGSTHPMPPQQQLLFCFLLQQCAHLSTSHGSTRLLLAWGELTMLLLLNCSKDTCSCSPMHWLQAWNFSTLYQKFPWLLEDWQNKQTNLEVFSITFKKAGLKTSFGSANLNSVYPHCLISGNSG